MPPLVMSPLPPVLFFPVALNEGNGLSGTDRKRTDSAARIGDMRTLRKVCKLSARKQRQVAVLIEEICRSQAWSVN